MSSKKITLSAMFIALGIVLPFITMNIPTLGNMFAEAIKTQPEPQFYSGDGVHPNANGAEFIAKHYYEAILPLIKGLI